jgi:hypothetical protein
VAPTLAVGGAEKQLALLVPRLRDRGFDPAVLTLRHEGRFFEELRADGIPADCLAMRSRFDLARARRALRAPPTHPHVVVTESIDAHVVGHLIARSAGAAHVAVEHAGPGLHRKLHHRLFYRVLAPRLDRTVAISAGQIPGLLQLGFRQ